MTIAERTAQGMTLNGQHIPWEELIPPRAFLRMCRRCAGRLKLADSLGTRVTGRQLLLRTLVLRRLLAREVLDSREQEQFVGVLIPSSVGGAVVNAALALDRRVAVNLNFTLSRKEIDHCIHTCGIRRVLTSRKVMEKLQLEFDAETVYLDDLREKITLGDKLAGFWGAYVQSIASLERQLGLDSIDPDELLTVIFTSGSTSMPKGVMLTQANIGSNVRAAETVVQLSDQDVMLCCVPFFHSLGYTITMWGALMLGFQGVCHASPLDAKIIGHLAQEYRATILISTPTFLRNYMRRLKPEEFASLDLVITGAEKLPQDLADAFEQHFGIRPLEGYGTTELSPLVSVNVPQHRSQDGKPHVRLGSVGQPVPGVAVRVVDPETKEPLPPGTDGMLWVTGPNVMKGYLNQPEKTAEVIFDGWYETGDIAHLDEEDYIYITGRLSRFSKIGGEMVPHIKVEEELQRALELGEDELRVAVTGVPDPKKGERLVVFYIPSGKSPQEMRQALIDRGLPNIFIPSADSFVAVEEIPVLGSGKLDLKRLRQMAEERFGIQKDPA